MTQADAKVCRVYEWCRDNYARYGIPLKFPARTDPKKTYLWRHLDALSTKLSPYDENTAQYLIQVAIEQAKEQRVIRGGLGVLLQPKFFKSCCQKAVEQDARFGRTASRLKKTREFLESHNIDLAKLLITKKSLGSLPNIVEWYRDNTISELYLMLSKSCHLAMLKLESDRILLLSDKSLYVKRLSFMSKKHDVELAKAAMQKDWRG